MSQLRYDVVWKEIKSSKDFVYLNSGDCHYMHIPEIFPEDASTHTCEAFNNVGECFSAFKLVLEVISFGL